MNKIIQKVLAVFATLTSIIALCLPVCAEETDSSYFRFSKDHVVLQVGDQYTIQFNKSDNVEITGISINTYNENVADYDEDTSTVVATNVGDADIVFNTSAGDYYFHVTVTDQAIPTSFKWYNRSFPFTMRDSESGSFSLGYNMEPNNAYAGVTIFVDDPDSVVDYNNGTWFKVKKAGTFHVTGTTELGDLQDTTEVNVLMGKYATGFNTYGSVKRLMDVGDSLDLNEDIKQYFLPENTEDFSDEKVSFLLNYGYQSFELKDGLIKAESQGDCQVTATLTNGETLTYSIAASKEPTSMWFKQKEYSYSKTFTGFSMKYELASDNNNAINYVPSEDIIWTAEGLDAQIDSNGCITSTNGEAGDMTVTAKYKDLEATCIIHFYDGDDPYAFEMTGNAGSPSGMKMHIGDVERLPVKVGKSNSIESVVIKSGEDKISYNEETTEITALSSGYASIEIKDKLGKTLNLQISCGPKAESISFKSSINNICVRDDDRWGKMTYLSKYLDIEPQDAALSTNIYYEVIGGDLDAVHISPTGEIEIQNAGTIKIKASTDDGLEATGEFQIHFGKYTTQPNSSFITLNLKPGETYNVSKDVYSLFNPKDADFSDEKVTYEINDEYIGGKEGTFTVDEDGTIHALKNGTNQIKATTLSGYQIYVNVMVCDKVNSINFTKKEYDVSMDNSYFGLSLYSILKTDPKYVAQTIDYSKVKYTISDESIAYISSPEWNSVSQLMGKKEGKVQLTAEYEGCKATTTVYFYYSKTPSKMDAPRDVTVHKGFYNHFELTYDRFANTETQYEIIQGNDLISLDSYLNTCTITGLKIGDATIKVTSKINPKLSKKVKVHVIDGSPSGATFKVTSYGTEKEIKCSGNNEYNLDLNQDYYIDMEYPEGEANVRSISTINSSDLIQVSGYGGQDYAARIPFRTLKPGILKFTAYPGLDVTFVIGFTDVTEDTAHADDIMWLAQTGVSQGWTEKDGSKTFRPYVTVARCDMAAFIRRLAKNNNWMDAATWEPSEEDWKTFADIDPESPHAEDVLWLAHSGVSQGWTEADGSKTFRPYKGVARCDMAAFLRRLASSAGIKDAAIWEPSEEDMRAFGDVDLETPHAEDVLWLAHSGVSKGWTEADGSKTFRSYTTVARSDMAAFLRRLAE